jgi:FkbM family methyltransferase
MSPMISRVLRLLVRQHRARNCGVSYFRAASFRMPTTIRINGREIALKFEKEAGVTNDFVGVFLDDMYALETLAAAPQTIVDVGANLGFFSMHARNLFPNARIQAYEPNVGLRPFLDSHASSVGFDVYYEAVGGVETKVSLEHRGDSNQTRTVVAATNSVPQVTLQSALERAGGAIDLLKMDCEGCEWAVLEDVAAMKQVKVLTMEYHCWAQGSSGHEGIVRQLRSLGLEVVRHHASSDWGHVVAVRKGVFP